MSEVEKELYYAMTDCDASNFSAMLFRLILKADAMNKFKLTLVYPEHVVAAHNYQNEEGYWQELCERMKKES